MKWGEVSISLPEEQLDNKPPSSHHSTCGLGGWYEFFVGENRAFNQLRELEEILSLKSDSQ